MENRRNFLKKTAMITAAGLGRVANGLGAAFPRSGSSGARGPLKSEDVLDKEKLKPAGTFYEATIPDTLDLAERARLSVRNLTHSMDADNWYYVYEGVNFGPKSPGPVPASRLFLLNPKNARALPMMRTVCGSDEGLDREYGLMRTMLNNVHEDGLLYCPGDFGGIPKDTSYPLVDGLMALACENHYALDGNPRWLEYIQLLATGLQAVAIRVDNRAYYPPEASINPEGKWMWTLRGPATLPYHMPEEPYLDQQGLEGEVKYEQAPAIRALVRAYKYGGNKQDILDLLRMLTRFDLKPGMSGEHYAGGLSGKRARDICRPFPRQHRELAVATRRCRGGKECLADGVRTGGL